MGRFDRINWLAGSVVAAVLVPILVFVLQLPFPVAVAIALIAGLGAGLVFTRADVFEHLDPSIYGQARITLVRELLAEAEPMVARIDAAGRAIKARETGKRVQHLASIASTILDGLAKDPGKLDQVRRFMTYLLPQAAEMAEAYGLLESTQTPDSARMKTSAEILDRLDLAFARYADSLIEVDLKRIDLDMKLLKASLDDDQSAILAQKPAISPDRTQ